MKKSAILLTAMIVLRNNGNPPVKIGGLFNCNYWRSKSGTCSPVAIALIRFGATSIQRATVSARTMSPWGAVIAAL